MFFELQGATSLGVVSEDGCVVCGQEVRLTSPFLTIRGGWQDCVSGTSWGSSYRRRRRHQATVPRGPLAVVPNPSSEGIRAPDKYLSDLGVLTYARGLSLWRNRKRWIPQLLAVAEIASQVTFLE